MDTQRVGLGLRAEDALAVETPAGGATGTAREPGGLVSMASRAPSTSMPAEMKKAY
jgi:hypothetical protein